MNHESKDLSPLLRLLIELHEKIRALVPNRKDLHCILNEEYNIDELSNSMMFLPWIIEAGKALSILESKFQSETTETWIDLANTINAKHQRSEQKMTEKMLEAEAEAEATPALISSSQDELSFLICSLLYLMEKTGRTQKEKDAFYFEHVIIPYLCDNKDNNNSNSNNNGSKGFQIERNAMQNKCHSYLPITRKWIQNRMMMTTNNITECHSKKDAKKDAFLINHDECYQARRLFIIKGWIESILFEEKNEIPIPEIFYLDVNRIRSIRNMTRLAVTGCALGLHAANLLTSNRDDNSSNNAHDNFLLNDKLSSERLVQALRGSGGNNNNNIQQLEEHQFSQSSYEECIEDTMVGIAQEWAEETTSSIITGDIIATLREMTKKVLRGQDPVIQLLNNRMKSIFLELALDENELLLLSSPTTIAAPYKMQSGRQKRIEGNSSSTTTTPTKEEELTDHPVFVKNAEQVFCSRGLALFATDLAHALLLSVKVPLLACDLYDKMIVDIIQENDYESVD